MLILIYAVVILGGTGSLAGMIVGAIAIIASNQVLDSTSPPNNAPRALLPGVIAGGLARLRPSWKRSPSPSAGRSSSGYAVHAIVDAVWSRGTRGQVTSGGFLDRRDRHWVLLPSNPGRIAG